MTSLVRQGGRGSLGFAAALLGALSAGATPELPDASASTTALPTPSGAEIPSAVSEPPSKAERAAAKRVRLHRGELGVCHASLVREWLELRCPSLAGAGLIAGDPTGVTIEAYGDPFAGGATLVTVQLPLRRGDARIVAFNSLSWGAYEGASLGESGILSVIWRPGRAEPLLVGNGLPGGVADPTAR